MNKAASGGMAEVKLGQLAAQKASNTAVKEFGMRMMADHSKAGDQLKDVAARRNVTLPASLDAKDQATYNRLTKLSGQQFDREYMKDMVQDHEQDVSEFKREAASGKNPDVKNFAVQTLPTLEQHLTLARQTEQQIGGSKGYEAKPAQ